jgi:hypothetical protein
MFGGIRAFAAAAAQQSTSTSSGLFGRGVKVTVVPHSRHANVSKSGLASFDRLPSIATRQSGQF